MKTKYITTAFAAIFTLALTMTSCHRDEKALQKMEGNWTIEESILTYHSASGGEQVIEQLSNCGTLIISEGDSDLAKTYDFFFVNSTDDTMKIKNSLLTDESRNRMMMMEAIVDSSGNKPIVWTIEKQKKNKQVWSTYGVDSTLFYPANNNDPGAATNWVSWQITLKRD